MYALIGQKLFERFIHVVFEQKMWSFMIRYDDARKPIYWIIKLLWLQVHDQIFLFFKVCVWAGVWTSHTLYSRFPPLLFVLFLLQNIMQYC